MKNISVCFDFRGVGHTNISIFPSDNCTAYFQDSPGPKEFSLNEGGYLLRATGVVSIAGGSIKVLSDRLEIAAVELPEGYFSRPLSFTV